MDTSMPDTSVDDARPDAGTDAQPDTAACKPVPEECNGRDDDCDSRVDEAGCPAGCTRASNAGREYLFCPSPRAWTDARTDCTRIGWDLAVLESAAEDAWVFAQAVSVFDEDWWVGLSDRETEATYVWVDGTVNWTAGAAVTYSNYRSGTPCDADEQDCLELSMEESGTWVDDRCSVPQAYVCELP
jgi:hypothetical protein